jgi:hypothetical protein
MHKYTILFISYAIAYQAKADYYEDFAKQFEKEHPEIAYPQRKTLTSQEVIDGWQTAHSHFKPGYRPVLDESGVLLDWVPENCPND